MTEVVLQGIASRFGEIIDDGTKLIYMEPGCMTLSDPAELLIDHKGDSLASTDDALRIHVGEKSLAFRFFIPESWTEQFKDAVNDFNTYLAVSVGMTITESKTMTVD